MQKFILLLTICLISISLVSCKEVQDENGPDNFELTTYTDSDFTKNSNGHLFVGSFENSTEGNYSLQANKLQGIYNFYTVNLSRSTVYYLSLTIESGNCRVVIIEDKTIIEDVPVNEVSEIVLEAGSYQFKIGGENAKFKLSMRY